MARSILCIGLGFCLVVAACTGGGLPQEPSASDASLVCIDGEERVMVVVEVDPAFEGHSSPRVAVEAALSFTEAWEMADPRLSSSELSSGWSVTFEDRTILTASVVAHNDGWVAGEVEFCSPTGFEPTSNEPVPPPTVPGAVVADLEEAEVRWAQAAVSDYELTVEYGCFCGPARRGPFQVVVEGGEVAEVRLGGEVVEPQPGLTPSQVFTVAGLFGEIRANIDAAVIDVSYDELGYPTLIDIDPDFDVIDDELTITATITVGDR